MEKAKTSWQAQDLIVDDNPSRSLCKPLFFIPMKSVDGWFYAAEPMHSGFHWEAGAAAWRNRCIFPRSPGTEFPSRGGDLPCTT